MDMTPKLTNDQIRAIHESGGAPILVVDDTQHQQYFLIPVTDKRVRSLADSLNGPVEWTAEKEQRRHDLIDRDITGTISPEERIELAILDAEGNAYYDAVAPRPIEGVRKLHRDVVGNR